MSDIDKEVLEVRQHSRSLVRELGFLQGTFGSAHIPYTQGHVLVELGKSGMLLIGELAERLNVDKSNISRMIVTLTEHGWVQVNRDPSDQRRKPVSLTPEGRQILQKIHQESNAQVRRALQLLSPEERRHLIIGLEKYSHALHQVHQQENFEVRPIEAEDNPYVAKVVMESLKRFGAIGAGYSSGDSEVHHMYDAYQEPNCACFVIVHKDEGIVGSGGIAPLKGGDAGTCELRKMFIREDYHGLGLGKRLLHMCLDFAVIQGFRYCYLETLEKMHAARQLYEKHGFQQLSQPLGDTGHYSCDTWYVKDLLEDEDQENI